MCLVDVQHHFNTSIVTGCLWRSGNQVMGYMDNRIANDKTKLSIIVDLCVTPIYVPSQIKAK